MSSPVEEEATISIPSLAFVAVLGYFIYRYFFSAPRDGADGSPSSSSRNNGLRFTAAQVEQIAQMFPQLSRRDIMWDLHRNGGSVPATTERVLTGHGLDPVRTPPTHRYIMMRNDIDLGTTGAAVVSTAYLVHTFAHERYKFVYDSAAKAPSARSDHAIQPPSQSKLKRQRQRGRITCAGLGE